MNDTGNYPEYSKVPVLFLLFNRPELTRKTFQSIRAYQPERLYIAADGPRDGNDSDAVNCTATRELVLSQIDWECDVHTLFREKNMGCGRGVSEGISWMLDQEEFGIVLEDDCVPCLDFFRFCEVLLPEYKDNDKIAQINGFDPLFSGQQSNTYFFTAYPSIWGWALWHRSWQHMDLYMTQWPSVRKHVFRKFPFIEASIHYLLWDKAYKKLKSGIKPDNWDFQWSLRVFMDDKLCINPYSNLVLNTGFGEDSMHCNKSKDPFKSVRYGEIDFPLRHPKTIASDKYVEKKKSARYVRKHIRLLKSRFLRMVGKW
jgi:hypothetical protein